MIPSMMFLAALYWIVSLFRSSWATALSAFRSAGFRNLFLVRIRNPQDESKNEFDSMKELINNTETTNDSQGRERCIYVTDFSGFGEDEMTEFLMENRRLSTRWEPEYCNSG
jgi:hypothetical protein